MIQLESTDRKSMPAYVVGVVGGGASRAVVVFTDVYGINTGNHKVLCDALAEQLGEGTLVIMPDLFRGVAILGGWGFMPQAFTKAFSLPSIIFNIKTRITRTNINSDLSLLVLPYLKEKLSGTATIASVGFCFGAWVVGLALALEPFNCQSGVAIHASWKAEVVAGGNLEALASSIGTKPILFLPSSTDTDTKADAPAVQQLAKQRGVEPRDISVEFPDQNHGWMTRANDSDHDVAQDREKALQVTVNFIKGSRM